MTGSGMPALLAMVALSGCVAYEETTRVRLREPALVEVGVDTPTGARSLLEPGTAAEQAPIPSTTPPGVEAPQAGANALRARTGAVRVACPGCTGEMTRELVSDTGEVALYGGPGDVLARTPDALDMRFDYRAWVPCHRGRGLCEHTVLSLWLKSPSSNVEEIRHIKLVATRHGELTGAWIGLITGLAYALGGGAFAGYGLHEHSAPLIGLGSGFLAVGSFFALEGFAGIRARDSDTRVFPAP